MLYFKNKDPIWKNLYVGDSLALGPSELLVSNSIMQKLNMSTTKEKKTCFDIFGNKFLTFLITFGMCSHQGENTACSSKLLPVMRQ
jgi:hypothetical protein